jgi:hypothetical protein
MGHDSYPAGPWALLIPLAVIALVLIRNARARNLRVERLWLSPALILAVTALAFAHQRLPGPAMIALNLAALATGVLLGWWRGRFTRISVDPATHNLTSQASPVGMLLILLIFAVRMGLRGYAAQNAGALHVPAAEVTDAFLLLAVGVVCAQRLEMALRATRLLSAARESRARQNP